jgi:hypothetical protein
MVIRGSRRQRRPHDPAKLLRASNDMIGRKNRHQTFTPSRSAGLEVKGGQSDGGGGVAPHRLGQNVASGNVRKRPANGGNELLGGDHPHPRRRKKRPQALVGLPEHRAVADNVDELFGGSRPAARPETSASATGQDHRVSEQL